MTDGPNLVYTGTRYGPYFVSNRHDPFFHLALERYGEWSWAEVELWRHLLDDADVVISAGANMGCHVVALGQIVGRSGGVIGFEPQLELCRVAQANTVLCNVDDQCRVIHAALGREDGQLDLPMLDYRERNGYGGLSLLHTPAPADVPRRAVRQLRIDSLHLDRCDLIQLDIEGMELAALHGAVGTVQRLRPALYLEVHYPQDRYDLYRFLRGMGYAMWWHLAPMYNPDNCKHDPENAWPDTNSISWVCLHESRDVPDAVAALRPLTDADWTDTIDSAQEVAP